ncbi:MAG: RagB/SusD family nutrient uptake outer membrane protein [Saprospiraceae bacterium]|nr:RagB/SusD family nutrient uptake outer membrane protein [Saprospiraceae bacterium]
MRNRSNPVYTSQPEMVENLDQLLDNILKERRIEFLGEGIRLMDLQKSSTVAFQEEALVRSSSGVAGCQKLYLAHS